MIIKLDENKNGVYSFTFKERLKILFTGKLIFNQIQLKKGLNAWISALFKLNDQLDEDVQKIISKPDEQI